jgi:hypothetical protein
MFDDGSSSSSGSSSLVVEKIYQIKTKDAGVKLYRAKIPVQSIKWG